MADVGLWVDTGGQIGAVTQGLSEDVLRLVTTSSKVSPTEAPALAKSLPETLYGWPLPRPRTLRQIHRSATSRQVRLTLGAETAKDGPRYYGMSVTLPTLTLRFLYEGLEAPEDGGHVTRIEDGQIVTLSRDLDWEGACAERLMQAGALQPEILEHHWPSEKMLHCDFVFVDGEENPETFELTSLDDAKTFAFRTIPALRRDGWEVIETPKWPYKISDEPVDLSVETQTAGGAAFQGNDWFSLGFTAEIGGKPVDVAPLIAAFLRQMRRDWDTVPDVEALTAHLAENPVYLDRGRAGYVALDLSPLARLLHLFLTHYAELGALHPSDATVARLAEEALAGSSVRFAGHAGILPLARSLQALAETGRFETPDGFTATLRDYQAYGAAWMGSLLQARKQALAEALFETAADTAAPFSTWPPSRPSSPLSVLRACRTEVGTGSGLYGMRLQKVRAP